MTSVSVSPFTAPAVIDPMCQLLRDLRAAGWCHVVEVIDTGRDSDGAPLDDGDEQHCWRRDDAAIRIAEPYAMYDAHDVDGDQFGDIAVGFDWIERYGIDGLRKFADHFGILTPPLEEVMPGTSS